MPGLEGLGLRRTSEDAPLNLLAVLERKDVLFLSVIQTQFNIEMRRWCGPPADLPDAVPLGSLLSKHGPTALFNY